MRISRDSWTACGAKPKRKLTNDELREVIAKSVNELAEMVYGAVPRQADRDRMYVLVAEVRKALRQWTEPS